MCVCVHCLPGSWPRVKLGWDVPGAGCVPRAVPTGALKPCSPWGMPSAGRNTSPDASRLAGMGQSHVGARRKRMMKELVAGGRNRGCAAFLLPLSWTV